MTRFLSILALRGGPAFLFLGQRYLGLDSGSDPFLSEILRKYGAQQSADKGYFALFDSQVAESGDASLAWMDDRCKRIRKPEWLGQISEFSWSGIYTSAIDSLLLPSFRASWRDVQPIFEEKYNPSDPRNRKILHSTFLFGAVNQADDAARPPLTRFEWSKRRQIAISLARRLPELVSPMGQLLIEGYAGSGDWMPLEEFLPIIDSFAPGQVHIFSAEAALLKSPDVHYLMRMDKLIVHKDSLATLLLRGKTAGLIEFGPRSADQSGATRVALNSQSVAVPSELGTS